MFFIVSIIVLVLSSAAAAVFFGVYHSAKLNGAALTAQRAKIKILGADGEEIGSDALHRYVEYADINSNIINAFVALEDKRFFNHKGVDYYRLVGAAVNNIKAGYFKEGGSTITQQLIKNTQLTGEKTLVRKIKEMRLAKEAEKRYSKEEIIEMYLNAIYFGNGIYGIDNACKTYFNKKPSEINVAESAILAGMVKSPQKYSPANNCEYSNRRMKLVLNLMKEQNFIDNGEYEEALSYKYKKPENSDIALPYFASVISEGSRILGIREREFINSPYIVETYYDSRSQNVLAKAFLSREFEIKSANGETAYYSALLADNGTGGFTAYYANKKYDTGILRRQPGSAIKPLAVYIPALEKNLITPASIVNDEKIDINGYSPSNFRNRYLGKIDVETAVEQSVNTVAAALYDKLDKNYVARLLKETGLTLDKGDDTPALSLGGMTYGLTNIELCEGYMTLANGGEHTKTGFIGRILSDGEPIYTKEIRKKRLYGEDSAYLMTDMLIKTAKNGTAKKLGALPFSVAGKTGTVGNGDGNTDAYLLSYTPQNTLCVWYGSGDCSAEQRICATGGGMPTLLSSYIYRNLSPPEKKNFTIPETVVPVKIDVLSWKNDDKLTIANETAPSKFKKEYLFSVRDCPSEFSKYFTDEVYLDIRYNDPCVDIAINYAMPFEYKLYREDVFTNEISLICKGVDAENSQSEHIAFYCDDFALPQKIYLYSAEIYYEGELICSTSQYTVFT